MSDTISALTQPKISQGRPLTLAERLIQMMYGDEGLSQFAIKQMKEREYAAAQQRDFAAAPDKMTAQIPGANPEASTGADALTGMMLSMGGAGLPRETFRRGETPSVPAPKPMGMSAEPSVAAAGGSRPPIAGNRDVWLKAYRNAEASGASPREAVIAASEAQHYARVMASRASPAASNLASPELITAIMEASEAAPPARRMRQSLTPNASAESGSGGSAEATSRISGMASRGQRFVIKDRGGNFRPATEDGALLLRPGEAFGILDEGGFQMLDRK